MQQRDKYIDIFSITQTGTGLVQLALVSVSVSDQCEHFYMVQYFSFGHGTSPVPVSVQCEYTMTANTVQADGAPSSVNQISAVSNLLTTILASQLTIRNKTNSKIEFICYKKTG